MKKVFALSSLVLAGGALHAVPIPISGQVLDAAGKPIAGAQAQLYPRLSLYEGLKASAAGMPPPATTAVTDAAGRFRFQAPEPGMWRVRVEARGSAARKIDLMPLLEPTELPPVRLEKDRGLAVQVIDPEGKPVPGTEVEIYPRPTPHSPWGEASSWEPTWARGTSDPGGRVTLPWGSQPPQYIVGRAPGFRRSWIEGIAGSGATLRLDRGCERVLEIVDPRGRPIAGALVDGGSQGFGPSGEDGRITVRGLCEEGTWAVVTPDGRRAKPAVPATSPDAPLAPFRVTLSPPPPSIQGRVLSAGTREPIAGALVWAKDAALDCVRTDARGLYSIVQKTPRGLIAAAPGHFPAGQAVDPRSAPEGPSFALPPASAQAGVVVDGRGNPVPGAELAYEQHDFRRSGLPKGLPAVSGADGRFRLMVPTTSGAEIVVKHEEFSPTRVPLPPAAASAPRPDVRVVLKKGAAVSGTVVDEQGQPLAGARVLMQIDFSDHESVIRSSSDFPETVAGAGGRFSFEHLPPGRYDLVARADGLAPGFRPGIEVREGRTELDPLVLSPGVTLEGRVVDTEGKPIEGARVSLQNQSQIPAGDSEVTTKPDGSFSFSALRPGLRTSISAYKDGYRWEPHPGIPVELPAARPVRIVLAQGCRITGRVVDERGRPVPDAELSFREERGSSSSSHGLSADREGFFEFSDASAGPLVLEAVAPGFRPTRKNLSIKECGLEDLEVVLQPGSWIVGRVVDGKGSGLPGARVSVLDSERAVGTDGEGRFRLEGMEPGPVTVTAQHSEYQRAVRDLEVRLGENRIDLVLEGGHEVRGRVTDAATGRPVPGVRVHLYPLGISHRMESDLQTGTAEDGSFAFPSVPSGEYSAGASAEGYRPASLEEAVRVVDGPVEGLEFRLRTGGTGRIRGRILGIESSNPGEVWVHATGPEGFQESGRVGSEGSYRIDRLPAGEWTVTAFAPEGTAEGRVTLAEGGEAELDLTFERGLTLSGRVTRAGAPVEGLEVFTIAGSRPARGTTDADGGFKLRGLAPGPCALMVSDPDLGPVHQETIEIAADRELRIELPVRRIAGHVVDAGDSSPIAGASVVLTRAEGNPFPPFERRATTGADGGFVLDSLSEGRYRIVARQEEFAPAEAVVHLESGPDPEGIRLALGPAAGLTLEVLSPAGRAPEWVQVVLLDAAGRVLLHDQQPTGENGRVRISSAPAGRVRVLVAARGAANASLDLTVPSEPVRVLLAPESRLEVSVPELETAGVLGEVTIQGPDGQPHWIIQGFLLDRWPLEGGRIHIDQLPAGTWRLRATTPDGRSWEGTATTVAGGSSQVVLE